MIELTPNSWSRPVVLCLCFSLESHGRLKKLLTLGTHPSQILFCSGWNQASSFLKSPVDDILIYMWD